MYLKLFEVYERAGVHVQHVEPTYPYTFVHVHDIVRYSLLGYFACPDNGTSQGYPPKQLGGLVVKSFACYAGGPGSIPGWGTQNFEIGLHQQNLSKSVNRM